ncbi:MAG: hypothetical protein P4L33_01015 [Capsulimonadaceae bacterium]|nr:hypothetical protein [Capsulimonadaceae bacterium]
MNIFQNHTIAKFCLAAITCLSYALAAAASEAAPPVPSIANLSYGPAPHQLMDIYLPSQGKGPFPVVIWYGTIWKPGKVAPGLDHFLPANVALAAVEVRTMEDAQADKVAVPVSYVLLDARRAVQFVRLHAKDYNLDPDRIATAGSSQGTLPALYVACAGEKADPNSSDPVERVSTRVTCVGAWRSQPSIDPKVMQDWVPGVKWGAPSLGCSFEESLQKRDDLLPIINQWSPDALLHKGTPPIYFYNNWGLIKPEEVTDTDYRVHSPLWALGFQKLAESRGVTCYSEFPGHPADKYRDMWDFLISELTQAPK